MKRNHVSCLSTDCVEISERFLVVCYYCYCFSLGIITTNPPNHYDLDQTVISHPRDNDDVR